MIYVLCYIFYLFSLLKIENCVKSFFMCTMFRIYIIKRNNFFQNTYIVYNFGCLRKIVNNVMFVCKVNIIGNSFHKRKICFEISTIFKITNYLFPSKSSHFIASWLVSHTQHSDLGSRCGTTMTNKIAMFIGRVLTYRSVVLKRKVGEGYECRGDSMVTFFS